MFVDNFLSFVALKKVRLCVISLNPCSVNSLHENIALVILYSSLFLLISICPEYIKFLNRLSLSWFRKIPIVSFSYYVFLFLKTSALLIFVADGIPSILLQKHIFLASIHHLQGVCPTISVIRMDWYYISMNLSFCFWRNLLISFWEESSLFQFTSNLSSSDKTQPRYLDFSVSYLRIGIQYPAFPWVSIPKIVIGE